MSEEPPSPCPGTAGECVGTGCAASQGLFVTAASPTLPNCHIHMKATGRICARPKWKEVDTDSAPVWGRAGSGTVPPSVFELSDHFLVEIHHSHEEMSA